MEHLGTILLLLSIMAGLYSLADRIKIPYPVLLVLGGLGISFIPGLPTVELEPSVVFLLFLPPLLFDAARNTPWNDFKQQKGPIARLAIGLVLFTTAGVAVCAYYIIPGFSWPLAFVLGAIVSPPDVVSAVAATKGLGLPKRVTTILEGESLVNDASALIAYRYAVFAVMSGNFIFWEVGIKFFGIALGGIVLGLLIGYFFSFVLKKHLLSNPTVETCTTILLPFICYVIAEKIHVSPVLSVVAMGLYVSWCSHELFSYQTRMQMNNFWDTFVFLLNGLVFILIGLQLPTILENIPEHSLDELIVYGLIVSATAIAIRMVWMFPSAYLSHLFVRLYDHSKQPPIDLRQLLIIGWSGMRGVVSLASAFALPLTLPNGADFPQRNTILFITFIVIFMTLVVQGLTLPWFIRILKVCDPRDVLLDEEINIQLDIARKTLLYIDEAMASSVHPTIYDSLKRKFERQVSYFESLLEGDDTVPADELLPRQELFIGYLQSEQAVINHQRTLILDMHHRGDLNEQVLRKIEQGLDIWNMDIAKKLFAASRVRSRPT